MGTYTITPSGLTSSNYSVAFVAGTLTVNPAALTVTANAASSIYGAPIPSFTYTLSGFAAGENAMIAGVTGSPDLTTTATQSSGAGPYTISVAAGTLAAANYDFPNLVNGTFTITPAPLTITADDETTVYGAPLPELTASYSGFVNGETPADLTTPVALTTEATSGSPTGNYAIEAFGAISPNYQISFDAGTLTIDPADTTTSVASAPSPSVFGQMAMFTATVAANAPGAGTPTGAVTFYANGTSIGMGMLSVINGQDEASLTTSTLSTGTDAITAAYTSGDGNFNPARSLRVSPRL